MSTLKGKKVKIKGSIHNSGTFLDYAAGSKFSGDLPDEETPVKLAKVELDNSTVAYFDAAQIEFD